MAAGVLAAPLVWTGALGASTPTDRSPREAWSESSPGAALAPDATAELHGDVAELQAAALEHGVAVVGTDDQVVHVSGDGQDVAALSSEPAVEAVAPAPRLAPSTTSEGATAAGVAAWHAGGLDGTGIDIAIVDLGFEGYAARVGTELPAAGGVHTSFGACLPGAWEGSSHGTAVAEIVHDVAPGATLHLLCVDDVLDLDQPSDAVYQYLRDNDIRVANAAIGSTTDSRRDGNGAID